MMRHYVDLTPQDIAFYESTCRECLARCRSVGQEVNHVEFKTNLNDPEKIGETVSALSNAVALTKHTKAYMIWGINDDIEVVGTEFNPHKIKKGNEPFESWLARSFQPPLTHSFVELFYEEKRLVLLEIAPAQYSPTSFMGQEYIKIGTTNQNLKKYPNLLSELWSSLSTIRFEYMVAKPCVDITMLDDYLDIPLYFKLTGTPSPQSLQNRIEYLDKVKLIDRISDDTYHILNLGAILFAKDLRDFENLAYRYLRMIRYNTKERFEAIKDFDIYSGYASAIDETLHYLDPLLTTREVFQQNIFRKTYEDFPKKALRELLVNALLHQDFKLSGLNPRVEVFPDRIEITNLGSPLSGDIDRLLDWAPQSRNEALMTLGKQIGLCEQRGMGIDLVIKLIEDSQLPPPSFIAEATSFKVILYRYKEFKALTTSEKIQACYYHAILQRANNTVMTNASLRQRFGLSPTQAASASKVIKDTLKAGKIKMQDETVGHKAKAYLPYFA
jgi:ATP-dependent DNA helicase RecG